MGMSVGACRGAQHPVVSSPERDAVLGPGWTVTAEGLMHLKFSERVWISCTPSPYPWGN